MNPAKEYLLQIQAMEGEINSLRRSMDDIRERLSLSGVRYDGDKIQVTAGDRMAESFARLDALERKQRKKITLLSVRRAKIINQIWGMPLPMAGILERRYLQKRTLEQAADDMGYSYDHARHLHGDALNLFYKTYKGEVDRWRHQYLSC